jgi:hypothetical protein
MEVYLHSAIYFMTWCFIKKSDKFTLLYRAHFTRILQVHSHFGILSTIPFSSHFNYHDSLAYSLSETQRPLPSRNSSSLFYLNNCEFLLMDTVSNKLGTYIRKSSKFLSQIRNRLNAEKKDVRANKNWERGITGRNNPQAQWNENANGWGVKMDGYSKASEIRDEKLNCTGINYLFVVTI